MKQCETKTIFFVLSIVMKSCDHPPRKPYHNITATLFSLTKTLFESFAENAGGVPLVTSECPFRGTEM